MIFNSKVLQWVRAGNLSTKFYVDYLIGPSQELNEDSWRNEMKVGEMFNSTFLWSYETIWSLFYGSTSVYGDKYDWEWGSIAILVIIKTFVNNIPPSPALWKTNGDFLDSSAIYFWAIVQGLRWCCEEERREEAFYMAIILLSQVPDFIEKIGASWEEGERVERRESGAWVLILENN